RPGLEVNLLVEVLAHIPDVHVARLLVEAEPPGVSQPKRPDLAKNLGISSKRVRRGDPIGISGVYIDSEDFTQERLGVLRIVVGVTAASAIAGRDIQKSVVGPELELAAVVVRKWLGEVQEDLFRSRIGEVRVACRDLVARDDRFEARGPAGTGVVDEEEAVLRIIRVEREAQKSLFAPVIDLGPDVEERRGHEGIRDDIDDAEPAGLIHHKYPGRVPGR